MLTGDKLKGKGVSLCDINTVTLKSDDFHPPYKAHLNHV